MKKLFSLVAVALSVCIATAGGQSEKPAFDGVPPFTGDEWYSVESPNGNPSYSIWSYDYDDFVTANGPSMLSHLDAANTASKIFIKVFNHYEDQKAVPHLASFWYKMPELQAGDTAFFRVFGLYTFNLPITKDWKKATVKIPVFSNTNATSLEFQCFKNSPFGEINLRVDAVTWVPQYHVPSSTNVTPLRCVLAGTNVVLSWGSSRYGTNWIIQGAGKPSGPWADITPVIVKDTNGLWSAMIAANQSQRMFRMVKE